MPENIFGKPGLATDQLPSVTSADNDKVLTVKNGKWDKAEPSGGGGGGGSTVVELTYADDVYTSTVKAGALWEAVTTGAVIFAEKSSGTIVRVVAMTSASTSDGAYYFYGGDFELEAASADDYPTYTYQPT